MARQRERAYGYIRGHTKFRHVAGTVAYDARCDDVTADASSGNNGPSACINRHGDMYTQFPYELECTDVKHVILRVIITVCMQNKRLLPVLSGINHVTASQLQRLTH